MTIQIQIDHGKPKQGVVLERALGKFLDESGLLESSDGEEFDVEVQIMPEPKP